MVEKIKTFLFSLNKPAALFPVFSQAAGDFAGHSIFFFKNVIYNLILRGEFKCFALIKVRIVRCTPHYKYLQIYKQDKFFTHSFMMRDSYHPANKYNVDF